MTVTTYEKSERGRVCVELLRSLDEASGLGEITLLPIPSVSDGKIRGTDISLTELISGIEKNDAVVGYALPEWAVREIKERGGRVCDLACDEEFLVENAALTAEAALGTILLSGGRAPRDLAFGVVGYGRIGKRIINLLLLLGAEVCVYTTSEKNMLELGEAGVRAELLPLSSDKPLAVDILINTAPSRLFEPDSLRGVRIMELASGENFVGVAGVEKYPSLPARVFPESAGRAMFFSVRRSFFGDGNG